MNPRVRLAVRFIKANLHRELTVDEISGVAGLKHSRLFELFQFEFSMAPLRYHRMLRLEKASGRLRNTLDKVEAIIVELGYDRRQSFETLRLALASPRLNIGHVTFGGSWTLKDEKK